MPTALENMIGRYRMAFGETVPFDPRTQKLLKMDFTEANEELTDEMVNNTELFTAYIENKLSASECVYGIGGYGELRNIYRRSSLFEGRDEDDEPRRLHLGIDIWGPAGTPIRAFMGGLVHSYAFNDAYGDYGATLILIHYLDDFTFHSLYGHISLRDIEGLKTGAPVSPGQLIGHFGESHENGHWPPHLHFQLVEAMGMKRGDYPGVCRHSEKEKYMANCPDPDVVLGLNRYIGSPNPAGDLAGSR